MKTNLAYISKISVSLLALGVASCSPTTSTTSSPKADKPVKVYTDNAGATPGTINPETWPKVKTAALDPKVEKRIDEIISQMTLEQKVGQVIQADSNAVTPQEVKQYRLGSVLSGGNSAPGEQQRMLILKLHWTPKVLKLPFL